jgi:hypothetical protein
MKKRGKIHDCHPSVRDPGSKEPKGVSCQLTLLGWWIQPAMQSRALAFCFETHWDGTLSAIEEKAAKLKRNAANSFQSAMQMFSQAMAPFQPARHPGAPPRNVPRQAPAQPAPRGAPAYTGTELRKGSVTQYAGPAPPDGVCRRWWYDHECPRAHCRYATSHTTENAGRGDPAP